MFNFSSSSVGLFLLSLAQSVYKMYLTCLNVPVLIFIHQLVSADLSHTRGTSAKSANTQFWHPHLLRMICPKY